MNRAQGAIGLGASLGTKNSNHSSSLSCGTSKIYRFFFTCLFVLWPIRVHTRAFDGIDLIIWRCLAPLFRQLSLFVGRGMLIKDPLSNGLQETTLILSSSAVSRSDPIYWFFSAKLSGIITFIFFRKNLLELREIWSHVFCQQPFRQYRQLFLDLNGWDDWERPWNSATKQAHNE